MEFNPSVFNIGLFLLFYLDLVLTTTETTPLRYADKTFLAKPYIRGITIYGKTVTCQDPDDHVPGKFPAQAWTCRDMRVDGRRMAYGYNPHFSEQKICTETKGLDELGEVCRSLMHKIGVKKRLWVSLISNATCDFIDEHRYMLNMTSPNEKNSRYMLNTTLQDDKVPGPRYRWDPMGPGNGWTYTLQCIAARD